MVNIIIIFEPKPFIIPQTKPPKNMENIVNFIDGTFRK
jgi:hypothetical protein